MPGWIRPAILSALFPNDGPTDPTVADEAPPVGRAESPAIGEESKEVREVVASSPADASPVVGRGAFRVEQRCGDAAVVIHEDWDLRSCSAEFGRLADQLDRLGASGVLHLVDRATGDVLDRRVLVGPTGMPDARATTAFAIGAAAVPVTVDASTGASSLV